LVTAKRAPFPVAALVLLVETLSQVLLAALLQAHPFAGPAAHGLLQVHNLQLGQRPGRHQRQQVALILLKCKPEADVRLGQPEDRTKQRVQLGARVLYV
jgi:hypothetical protein